MSKEVHSIKCISCKHDFMRVPSKGDPHGEYACMKRDMDLHGIKAEDVENCEDYEPKDINIRDMPERGGHDDC